MRTFVCAVMLYCVAIHAQESIPPTYGQPPNPPVVTRVQTALKAGDLKLAEDLAGQYQRLNGYTPEALLALGWAARGELAAGQINKADATAAEIFENAEKTLAVRAIDAEPYLPLALGTAYEVQAEVLFAKGQRAAALQLLQKAAVKWHDTSLDDRLEKNINLLTLRGRPMPVLRETEWIGKKPVAPAALRGKVLLLFFWAHWCSDCKAEAPVLAKLATELNPRGFVIVAPTRRYGYTRDNDHATAAEETPFITKVYDHYYASVPTEGIPVDRGNFERYGASTTPTLVLVDRHGIVRLYHPGLMSEADLRGAVEALLRAN